MVSISTIVQKLVQDELLIVERTQFAQALDTPTAERVQWETLFTMGVNSANAHFTKLLENWVQRLGPRAQLGKLGTILKSCDFISAFGECN